MTRRAEGSVHAVAGLLPRAVAGLVATFVVVRAAVPAAEEIELRRAEYPSPRLLALGGAFAAVGDDRNLLFVNPAGLGQLQRTEVGFELLRLSLNDNTISAAEFFADNRDRFEDLSKLSDEEQAEFYDDLLAEIGGQRSEVSAQFPLWLLLPSAPGSRRPHLGFGFFARGGSEFLSVNGASGIPVATLDLEIQYTGILSIAYSWDRLLPGRLTLASSFKVDHRELSLNRKSLLALSEEESIDFLGGTAFGLDLGAMYQATPSLRVGASVSDAVSGDYEFGGQNVADPLDVLNEEDVGKVDPAFVLGTAYENAGALGPFQGLLLALDIREPFDDNSSFWKGIHMGAESRLAVLALRFGFFQGYPGGGFGLGPLQYAYYSNEVGNFPGARSNYQHAFALSFRFGI